MIAGPNDNWTCVSVTERIQIQQSNTCYLIRKIFQNDTSYFIKKVVKISVDHRGNELWKKIVKFECNYNLIFKKEKN